MDFKQNIIDEIKKIVKAADQELKIEVPPDQKLGDFAVPCFQFSRLLKKDPIKIAEDLKSQLKGKIKGISEIKVVGPYINFYVENAKITKEILEKVTKEKKKFGLSKAMHTTILIESPGPNTNKPLHLGHVRNMLLGNALVNINKAIGNKTFRVDIVNDRGVHICKSMLAYQKFGENKKPDKKSDHFVGNFYVLYANYAKDHPEAEEEIQLMLKKWEDGDKKTIALWKKMNDWALSGFKETYARFGVKIDKAYHESKHYKKGKAIILNALKKGVFSKDDEGNIFIDLEEKGLGKKIVLRADGTSIYITQDIALVDLRFKEYKMDKIIYVVGNEQIHHFKALFEILTRLGYKFAQNCYHLAYGMIALPEGKMKSREGTVVDADDLAADMRKLAKEEIAKRHDNLSAKELEKRAEQIGMAAIKFFILKYDPMKDFIYDPKTSLDFEGETGPYVQYAHARICSILKKAKENKLKPTSKIDFSLLKDESEHKLITMLSNFSATIAAAAEHYKPSTLCRYVLDLAQAFNEFYHKCVVVDENSLELSKARLLLADCVRIVLENGLNLLGIEAPDEM